MLGSGEIIKINSCAWKNPSHSLSLSVHSIHQQLINKENNELLAIDNQIKERTRRERTTNPFSSVLVTTGFVLFPFLSRSRWGIDWRVIDFG